MYPCRREKFAALSTASRSDPPQTLRAVQGGIFFSRGHEDFVRIKACFYRLCTVKLFREILRRGSEKGAASLSALDV